MAITSTGYERAITYAELGMLLAHAGAAYSVFGADSFAVWGGAGTREVLVQPGRVFGYGILDESDAVVSLTGSAVSSGDRWDLVALRRDWVAGTSTVVLIPGGGSQTLPARNTTPGVLDDQPIALVRFSAGQASVMDVVDLRVWHGPGGYFASSPLVRGYLEQLWGRAAFGVRVYVADRTYVRVLDAVGVARWVTDSVIVSSAAPVPADVPWLKV